MQNQETKKIRKIPVQVLGATGAVGRKMVGLLKDHPYFTLEILSASEQSEGKLFKEVDPAFGDCEVGRMCIQSCKIGECPLVFSALDATVAKRWEQDCIDKGIWVFSNARIFRMQPGHLLSIPEISYKMLDQISKKNPCVVTNPNCCVSGLALALYPLAQLCPIRSVNVFTQQSVSGAGYPGVPSLDILGNIIPFIEGEEVKIIQETKHLLASVQRENSWSIYPTCTRVPTLEGHLITAHVDFEKPLSRESIINAWSEFTFPFSLPSAIRHPLVYMEGQDQPQVTICVRQDRGMRVYIGGLRVKDSHAQFTLFTHNLIRGAAGGALLNAEMWHYFKSSL